VVKGSLKWKAIEPENASLKGGASREAQYLKTDFAWHPVSLLLVTIDKHPKEVSSRSQTSRPASKTDGNLSTCAILEYFARTHIQGFIFFSICLRIDAATLSSG